MLLALSFDQDITSTVCGLSPRSSCVVIMQMTLIRLPFTYHYRNMPNLPLPEDVCKKSLRCSARGYVAVRAFSQWDATRRGTFPFSSFFFFCILHRKIVDPRMTRSRENRICTASYNRNTRFPPSSFELLARFSFWLVKIDCSFRLSASLFHFSLFFFSVEASMHSSIVQRIRFNLLLLLSTCIVSEV